MPSRLNGETVGLPARPFLYTIDQIATLLGYSSARDIHNRHFLFYAGRQTGQPNRDEMLARDIASQGEKPEWRVAEHELIRWLKFKGFRINEPRWLYQ